MTKEHRRAAPVRTFKVAHVEIDERYEVCTVLNMSTGGALLVLQDTIDVPPVFPLHFVDGTKRDCQIVHRRTQSLGVAFVEPESLAHEGAGGSAR